MLVDFTEERDKSLRGIVSQVQDENTSASADIHSFSDNHNLLFNESSSRSRSLSASVEKAAVASGHAKLTASEVCKFSGLITCFKY